MTDTELADKLMHFLIAESQHKADLFDYLCWLEETHQSDRVKGVRFLVLASDGFTCWGETYAEAVESALAHDKDLYEAWQQFKLHEPEVAP